MGVTWTTEIASNELNKNYKMHNKYIQVKLVKWIRMNTRKWNWFNMQCEQCYWNQSVEVSRISIDFTCSRFCFANIQWDFRSGVVPNKCLNPCSCPFSEILYAFDGAVFNHDLPMEFSLNWKSTLSPNFMFHGVHCQSSFGFYVNRYWIFP